MDNKQIEEKLKESMLAVEPENFSDRLDRIHNRLNENDDIREVATEKIAVGVSSEGTILRHSVRMKLIVVAATFIFAVCIGVIIWNLVPDKSIGYTTLFDNLGYQSVEEGDFYDRISENKIPLIDTSSFHDDIYSYNLLSDKENNIFGGMLSAENETVGYVLTIEFCMENVGDFKKVEGKVNAYLLDDGQELRYVTVTEGDEFVGYIYTTTASVLYNNMNYYVTYISIEDNALSFLEDIF